MPESSTVYKPGAVLITEEEIAAVVARLGKQISADYRDRHPILLNLLKGGVVFLADLIRQITIAHQIDFLRVSSYDNGTSSSGNVRIIDDLTGNVEGRDVLIVEDVLDTGKTLAYIVDVLKLRSPNSIEVCALLRKRSPRTEGVHVGYLGKEIPDVFVVGYGLDYNEKYRHLPHIAKLIVPR